MELMHFVWLAVIVIVGMMIVRGFSGVSSPSQPPSPPSAEPAEEIVRRRYATGEISRSEYETLMRDLRR